MRFLVPIAEAVRKAPRWVAVLAFLTWTGLIFWLSSLSPSAPDAPSSTLRAWAMNLRHAPAFGLFALLFLWGTSRRGRRLAEGAARVNWALLAVLVYGLVDERHQFYTPGRDASASDILTNLAGGWLCASVLRAVEDGTTNARLARILLIGVPACCLAALVATLVPPLWPELTWL